MSPKDILLQELKHQLQRLTHRTREGSVFCRTRHDDVHGWHEPGSRAKVAGLEASGCVNCQNYIRIRNALVMAGLPNPEKRCVVRTETRWVGLDGKSYLSQDAAYVGSAIHSMKHNLTVSSFRYLKRVKTLRGDRMYSPEANAYEMRVAKRLEQWYRHIDQKGTN